MNDVQISDFTSCCVGARPRPSRLQSLVWIHRIGKDAGVNAKEIAHFFIHGEGSAVTGGNMAYHYIVTLERVEQALPLTQQGAHARRWGNAHGIGIAVSGDFRFRPATPKQWALTVSLCADLVPFMGRHSATMFAMLPSALRHGVPVVGHGEVPGAYGATSQREQPMGAYACPGRHWPMHSFRADVSRELARRAIDRCASLGHRF